jgi:hypothetical protein
MGKVIVKAHEVIRFSNNMSNKEVRSAVKEETGFAVRRLDNVTLTSLNAVYRLMENNLTSKKLALYSGADYMSVELFQSVILAMENKEAIRPFDFISTVGNAANYYLTKEFNIKGPNIFIGASEHTLLKNIMLAETDIMLGHCEQAIIVIWQINDVEQRCHALLIDAVTVETTKKGIKEVSEWHHPLVNGEDLLKFSLAEEYPLLLNL